MATFMEQRGNRSGSVWCFLALGTSAALASDLPGDIGAMISVTSLEQQRFAAMVKGDIQFLDKVLARDLTYCHSNALCDTKQYFLDGIDGGRLKYISIEPSNVHSRQYNGTIVSNGEAKVTAVIEGKEQTFRIVYTDVYANVDGRLQLVAWQSTRVPEAPPK
jgi:hypothetical protein